MVITENIYTAKTHFSRLIQRALEGDEVIIAKAGKPLVCLVPYTEKSETRRKPGSANGTFTMKDDFDEAFPPDLLEIWER